MIYTPIEYGKRVGKSKIRPVDFINFIILVLRMTVRFVLCGFSSPSGSP